MTIQDLGSIGELVAALATIATLAYLAVQIRQNTNSLRATAYQNSVESANEWAHLFIHHPETVDLFRKGLLDPDSLEPAAATQFQHILEVFLRNYATVRQLTDKDLIPRGICDQYEASIRRFFSRPGSIDWLHRRSPGWRKLIDSVIAV